jgi:hypothetical protein
LQNDPKNDTKAFIVIFGVHFVMFAVFFVFIQGKTVGPIFVLFGGFLYIFRAKKVGEF